MLNEIKLSEGMKLGLYCQDADDEDRPDELIFEGTVHFHEEKGQWCTIIDEKSYRLASELLRSRRAD